MRADILKAMYGLGSVFKEKIDDNLIHIWCSVLKDLSPQELLMAVEVYCKDPENKFFPRVGQIYGLARPKPNFETEAQLLADRVYYAGCAYGADSEGIERARKKVGELGWKYIQNQGGFQKFIDLINEMGDPGTIKSQIRKSVIGLMEQNERQTRMESLEHQSRDVLKKLGVEMKVIP